LLVLPSTSTFHGLFRCLILTTHPYRKCGTIPLAGGDASVSIRRSAPPANDTFGLTELLRLTSCKFGGYAVDNSLGKDATAAPTKRIEAGRPGISPARIPINGPKAIVEIENAGIEGLLPAWTFHECFRAAAALNPTKAANIYIRDALSEAKPRTIDFGEMIGLIEQAANLFRLLSEDRQAVVSVLAPLLPEALIAMWGAAIAGVANPINPSLDVSHVAGIMTAAQTNILVTATSAHGPGAWDHISTLATAVPTLRAVLVIDPANSTDGDFLTRVKMQPSDLTFTPDPNPDRISGYFHTGGTTALPKLVRHTQRGQLLNAWISASHMGPAADEVVGHGMPNFHVGGAILLSLRSLIMGQTLLTLTPHGFRDRGVVRDFWNVARQYGMTSLLSAPTTAAMMLADDEAKSSGHSLRTFTVGGGAMPRSLGTGFQDRFGLPLREIWGMTRVSRHPVVQSFRRYSSKDRLRRTAKSISQGDRR
jgi:fatty-acyl-CoA synthase